MSAYRRYPSYKASGREWLGQIPALWEATKLKYCASYMNSNVDKKSHDDEHPVQLCNYTDAYYNEFVVPGMSFMSATASADEISRFQLKASDIIITKDSEDPSDIGIPSLVKEDMPGVLCGYHLTVIRSANSVTSRYLHRAIESQPTKAHFFVEAPGITRFGLGQDAIGSIPVALPPLEDRGRIANYIDSETARIDTLIEKKTRFIELLKEKRQALITRAVTKGLDPDVPMKDSGVEWIGNVPSHWVLAQLGKVTVSKCDGPFGSGLKSSHYTDGGVRVVRLQNIGPSAFQGDGAYISEDYWRTSLGARHDVQPGDILMAGLGDENNPLGRACVAPKSIGLAMVKADCYRFRLDSSRAFPEFVAHALSVTAAVECGYMATGATRARLNLGLASARSIPLPPLQEQIEIVDWVNRRTRKLHQLIENSSVSINLLHERRSALITAAVTGQIDLRQEAA